MNRIEVERLTGELLAGRISQADFVAAVQGSGRYSGGSTRGIQGSERDSGQWTVDSGNERANVVSRGAGHGPSVAELGDVTLDLDRQRRCGFPEVVFGQSKSVETLVRIFRCLLEERQPVLATRIDVDKATELLGQFPEGRYNAVARTFRINRGTSVTACSDAGASEDACSTRGLVSIVTAGTSDMPVAEEVRETADWMGAGTDLVVDVGVAGPQRLLAKLERITKADAVVVVAGMEAALASVVGGHVACPVIAVPTSVGYGASLGGIAALLGMLNSCAANVCVVNIDAGFKAGYLAGMIAVQKHRQVSK